MDTSGLLFCLFFTMEKKTTRGAYGVTKAVVCAILSVGWCI